MGKRAVPNHQDCQRGQRGTPLYEPCQSEAAACGVFAFASAAVTVLLACCLLFFAPSLVLHCQRSFSDLMENKGNMNHRSVLRAHALYRRAVDRGLVVMRRDGGAAHAS